MAERKREFFHGTTFDLRGPDILPSTVQGRSIWGDTGHSGQRSREHAFATENEGVAWQFASQAGMMARANQDAVISANAKGYTPKQQVPNVGRVQVHTVAPNPLMQRGVFNAEHPDHNGMEDLQEWKAPAFRVTGTQHIMPGRQGTFSNINWNQFRKVGAHYDIDTNHPSDREVEVGHYAASTYWHRNWSDFANRRGSASQADSVPPGVRTNIVDDEQMDLFSGKTVGEHVSDDDTGYHEKALFGHL